MIERVLMNLLGNAIKFTAQGNIAIQYGMEDYTESDNPLARWLKISVQDSGSGIPADKQADIFGLFTRVSPAYQGIYEGHGLGLYITKKLITLMGGTIDVNSEGEDNGTTFTCMIPVTLTNQSLSTFSPMRSRPPSSNEIKQSVQSESPVVKPDSIAGNQASRVLLVEDNRIAIKVASSYLARCDCNVTVAPTLKEALAFAKNNRYDCIFMDVGLPDGDGRDATRTIRSTQTYANVHTPIIGLTAHADPNIQQDCLAAGMNAVYSKPLTLQRIETVLNDIVVLSEKTHHTKDGNGEALDNRHADHLPILDVKSVADAMGCDESVIYDILADTIDSIATDKCELEAVFHSDADDKWQTMSGLAHRIRGACGYCGALQLQESCAALEQQYRSDSDSTKLVACYQALIQSIASLESAYSKLV